MSDIVSDLQSNRKTSERPFSHDCCCWNAPLMTVLTRRHREPSAELGRRERLAKQSSWSGPFSMMLLERTTDNGSHSPREPSAEHLINQASLTKSRHMPVTTFVTTRAQSQERLP
jgi:hypothetical protein